MLCCLGKCSGRTGFGMMVMGIAAGGALLAGVFMGAGKIDQPGSQVAAKADPGRAEPSKGEPGKAEPGVKAPSQPTPATTPQPGAVSPTDKPTEPKKDGDKDKSVGTVDAQVLGFSMKRIDGTMEDLSVYRGKVVVIVNVASKCGFTPQYAGLEKLFASRKDKGLVVLGFPANDFGNQEPGTNEEIQEFCSSKFGVTFPLFEKVSVKGPDAAPLFKKLAGLPAPIGGEPRWNFTKFVVDRSGNAVARFASGVKPEDDAFTKKIDELLNVKP